jgi:hypothetical protein
MKSYARVPWMMAALAAALLAATATAADPKDKDAATKEAPAKVDKDVEAWVKVLVEKIADRHDSIRESARHALIAVGKPALPALQKLADGDDGAAAEAAKRVIAHIEGGDDGYPGHHGFPGEMGQRHPGFHQGSAPPHPGGPGVGPHPGGFPGQPGGFGPPPGAPGAGGAPGFPPGPPGGFVSLPGGPPGMGGPGGPGAMIEHAMKDLNLTAAQKAKVKEVLKAQGEKAHQTFEKMHEDFLKSLKGVLDEEQFKKLEKNLPKPPAPGDLPGLSDKPKPPEE